ncbi:cytosine/uracil/thiamine/allantoin permease [Rhodoblastus sphagnicola]|nr:hypothetical protein [Rhodoblastus sphagnicola]MBB4200353.1 cytosine/uracil/thiamine/allantoin permease [Rhodoblastus sphagnicola]
MAFEILDPLPPFKTLSPTRRVCCVIAALAAVAFLIWACATVKEARETIQMPAPSRTTSSLALAWVTMAYSCIGWSG